jgi:iron complex transport system permease protein
VIKHRRWFLVGLLLLAGLAVLGSSQIGAVEATPEIFWRLRIPRVLLGLVVGFALSVAGVLFQGVLRNPLADPYVLGTSSGAAVGVLLASVLQWRATWSLYVLALAGAFAATMAVYQVAQRQGRAPVQTLILAGVLVSTFLNAVVFLIVSLFYKEAFSTLFFLLGTLTESDPRLLLVSSGIILAGSGAAWVLAARLNILSQGDDTALHLGVNADRTRRAIFFVASAMVGAAVAAAGMIGFVGLMVPHLMRLLIGPDHRTLIPASALGGGTLLVVMDAVARTAAAPVEIPVGVLAAITGTPFLIYLLRRSKGEIF